MGRAGVKSPRAWAPQALLLLCVFLVVCELSETKSPDSRSGASLLRMDDDPLGEMDVFPTLTEKDRQYWGRLGSASLAEKAKILEDLEVSSAIEVRLVGFDGEGAESIKVKEASSIERTRRFLFSSSEVVVLFRHSMKWTADLCSPDESLNSGRTMLAFFRNLGLTDKSHRL